MTSKPNTCFLLHRQHDCMINDCCGMCNVLSIMRFIVVALLLFKTHKHSKCQFVHSCNMHTQCGSLSQRGCYIRQRRIPQTSLLQCTTSPWCRLLSSNNDQAMITLTGITNEAFNYLLAMFALCMMSTLHLWTKTGLLSRRLKRWEDLAPFSLKIA